MYGYDLFGYDRHEDGQHYVSSERFDTRAEAEEALRELIATLDSYGGFEVRRSEITVH